MRPVFFRKLPTLDPSFFSSTFALVVGDGVGLATVFLTGTAAAVATVALAGSGFGCSVDGCDSGVGFTSGTRFDVLAALDGGGGVSVFAFRWMET